MPSTESILASRKITRIERQIGELRGEAEYNYLHGLPTFKQEFQIKMMERDLVALERLT